MFARLLLVVAVLMSPGAAQAQSVTATFVSAVAQSGSTCPASSSCSYQCNSAGFSIVTFGGVSLFNGSTGPACGCNSFVSAAFLVSSPSTTVTTPVNVTNGLGGVAPTTYSYTQSGCTLTMNAYGCAYTYSLGPCSTAQAAVQPSGLTAFYNSVTPSTCLPSNGPSCSQQCSSAGLTITPKGSSSSVSYLPLGCGCYSNGTTAQAFSTASPGASLTTSVTFNPGLYSSVYNLTQSGCSLALNDGSGCNWSYNLTPCVTTASSPKSSAALIKPAAGLVAAAIVAMFI